MKRLRLPGLFDVVLSEDVQEIESFTENPLLDRAYSNRSLPLNAFLLARVRKILQINGQPFPTVSAREAPGRAAAQAALWNRLNALSQRLKEGPEELESLAGYVRGESFATDSGPFVQEVVGRLFTADFRATPASWSAALVLDQAPRTINPVRLAWWAMTGRVERSKRLLSGMVGGDLAGVHAVGIALHNIVSGVELMHQIYSDPLSRNSMSPEAVATRCLVAPAAVLRQPTAFVGFAGAKLTPQTVVVLKLEAANVHAPNGNIAFLRESWSRCPAERWVPALLEGIWRRACPIRNEGGGSADRVSCPFPRT